MKRQITRHAGCIAALASAFLRPCFAEESAFSGDIGAGVVVSQARVRGAHSTTDALPYLNFEYGRAFARIDTFGVGLIPLGLGHLELLGQYRGDGYSVAGLQRRQDAVPIGLGTLQVTPVGAFAVSALHDFGRSGGNLVQARYLAELPLGRVTFYPELGVEWQSGAYTRYYDGTVGADATSIGRSYRPGAALNPYVGALIETRITRHFYLDAYVRETSLDRRLSNGPFGPPRARATAMVALAYRF